MEGSSCVTLTSDMPGSLLPACLPACWTSPSCALCDDARGFSGRIHTSGGESVEGHRMEESCLWFTDVKLSTNRRGVPR